MPDGFGQLNVYELRHKCKKRAAKAVWIGSKVTLPICLFKGSTEICSCIRFKAGSKLLRALGFSPRQWPQHTSKNECAEKMFVEASDVKGQLEITLGPQTFTLVVAQDFWKKIFYLVNNLCISTISFRLGLTRQKLNLKHKIV